MAADRDQAPDQTGEPVPRDLPDQQADTGEDPWEVPVAPADDTTEADDVPDMDEAGARRPGAAQPGRVHPEHPAPQEPTG